MSVRATQKQKTRQALFNAALQLSYQKGSFANISLREITHKVEIVPAAFYRHYTNLDQLGLELVDHVSVYVRHIFYQIGKLGMENLQSTPESRLDFLFDSIDQQPEMWHFFLAERLSGNLVLRHAIQREHHFLLQEFTQRVLDMPSMAVFCEKGLAPSLSSLYLQSAFHWAIQWIEFKHRYNGAELIEKQQRLRHSALKQIQLLYLALTA